MEPLVIYPENKKQLSALKAVMRALKMDFVEQKEIKVYPKHVIDGVKKSLEQADTREGLLPYTGINDMFKQP